MDWGWMILAAAIAVWVVWKYTNWVSNVSEWSGGPNDHGPDSDRD